MILAQSGRRRAAVILVVAGLSIPMCPLICFSADADRHKMIPLDAQKYLSMRLECPEQGGSSYDDPPE